MDEKDRTVLRDLLTRQRVATLAILIDERPYASLVPFALSEGGDAVLIHASQLAKHSDGLGPDAPYSLLLHQSDSRPDTNPAQLARLTILGTVKPIARDSEEYSSARDRYLAKFPKSQITFQLADFTLYALAIDSCRFVAGFGKTFDLEVADLQSLS